MQQTWSKIARQLESKCETNVICPKNLKGTSLCPEIYALFYALEILKIN